MPEGPEIRLAADEIAKALVDRPTTEVFFAFDHLKPYEAKLSGRTVTTIETYGKAMLTRFDNELNIYSHNQLYGIWKIRKLHDYPNTKRQLRLAIHNEEKSALLYSASDIEVLEDWAVQEHPFIKKIGPDLLDPSVTVDQVAVRYISDQFKRRRLATILLDQGFLAGIGNYLRSEILYVAGVHPKMRPIDCTPEQIQKLAEASVRLTRQSYQTKGITNDPELVKQLKKDGLTRAEYRYFIFNRENKSCYGCGNPIIKEMHGSRRLYLCEICQPPN
ncbi:MAG: endonuclease VIII [Anaerolineae bacterium]